MTILFGGLYSFIVPGSQTVFAAGVPRRNTLHAADPLKIGCTEKSSKGTQQLSKRD